MLAYLDENQKKRQKLILTLLTRNPLMMDDLLQKESEEVAHPTKSVAGLTKISTIRGRMLFDIVTFAI